MKVFYGGRNMNYELRQYDNVLLKFSLERKV